MNRYFQKILETIFRLLLNLVYFFKFPYIWRQNKQIISKYNNPIISIIVPIYKTNINHLKACIESVTNQSSPNWQLILIDDNSNQSNIDKYLQSLKSNPKIKILKNSNNLNIVTSTNKGIQVATGSWVAFLDHDDLLWSSAISQISKVIKYNSNIQYIYTDSDKINEQNHHTSPFLKPDFNLSLLHQVNYINHFSLINRQLLIKLNNLRPGTNGAQDWDLALRTSKIIKAEQFFHIPKILYSWRETTTSTASKQGMVNNKFNNIAKVQKEILEFNGIKSATQTRYLGIWTTNNQLAILPYQLYLISLIKNFSFINGSSSTNT
ncbi:MAG: glycosyltransferase [Candidatus Shapirobacteria bacterium]